MINQLNAIGFFKQLSSILIYGILAIVVCICLVKLLKAEGGRQLIFYILCGVIIIAGIIVGIQFYKELTAKSYINGQIDISNQFVSESFEYKSSSVVFTKNGTTNTYTYEIDLTKVEDFNGENKKYEVKLNDYVLFNAVITAGSVSADLQIDFYDTNNSQVCSSELKILVEFINNKTKLKLATEGASQAEFLTQYFEDYGFRLNIAELKGD